MTSAAPTHSGTCFFERDPGIAVAPRAIAEGVGTLLLVLAAAGAGLAVARLAVGSPAITLIAGAAATAGALVGLIIAFGEISGGHFNPLITGLQWLVGERPLGCTLSYVAAQCVGGIAGALLANGLFDIGGSVSAPPGVTWPTVLSEVVASAGLMTVVFSCARSGRKETGPFAVGAWLMAAIIATPSTSYANPAIAIAALFTGGPIALSPSQALAYVPAEIGGALIALIPVSIAYPRGSESYSAVPRTSNGERPMTPQD
jgi:glycerol uptake facilitator-like aquaporin